MYTLFKNEMYYIIHLYFDIINIKIFKNQNYNNLLISFKINNNIQKYIDFNDSLYFMYNYDLIYSNLYNNNFKFQEYILMILKHFNIKYNL